MFRTSSLDKLVNLIPELLTMNDVWENLRLSHVGLPPKLRPAQSDALYWLSQDKSVILCVGTGVIIG